MSFKTTYPDKPIKDFTTWKYYITYLTNLYDTTRNHNRLNRSGDNLRNRDVITPVLSMPKGNQGTEK